jgi:hypothetical protein
MSDTSFRETILKFYSVFEDGQSPAFTNTVPLQFVAFHVLTYLRHMQVLGEDLRLVEGQQDRMLRGANVWNHPVAYDKLGVRYRRWREQQEAGSQLEHSPIEDDFD